MNKLICLFSIIITNYCCAQLLPDEHLWTATLKCVDETGAAVAGVKVSVDFSVYNDSIVGPTDTNGFFIASHRDATENLGIRAEKTGYYSCLLEHRKGAYDVQRWNPAITIVLRKIENPIPMYAKRQGMTFPRLDESIGFDLNAGDWVAPDGKGTHTDLLFKGHREIKNRREYSGGLTVTFPNQGDGLAIAPSEQVVGSKFKTSRTAAGSGYESQLIINYSSTEKPANVFGYFLRVRTKLNPDGTINSAFYGKIDGNFKFYAGTVAPTAGMGFNYYLNPVSNNRNLEFDPKHNLIKNLKPLEGVSEP